MKKLSVLCVCMLHISLLSAAEQKTVGVNLHGVNYSENTFRFFVMDPTVPTSSSGGELVDPFGAGGITCCATLPKNWRPGTKLEIRTIHWLKTSRNGESQEIHQVHQVDVPRYASGKPGELWILRRADGKISAVSSDFEPNHPNWPGEIKGWPIPSLEHRRERWAISKKHEEAGVNAAVSLLNGLQKSPIATAGRIWKTEKQYSPEDVAGFTGPSDPKYIAAVKKRIEQGLAETRQRLNEIMEARP
ncbi:DUF3304 domain-containing protein [Telluria aromaticivorans]|uniref:DUF3304 domain-containing protein n=1 Tax=Telluria aromaticivorans TaxID=2725995 RepID=A0A7Y2JXY2_9BURK|nr:DUF3304 domain-containing protein [Telluria aromaticivorans]NNG22763.1 DUF3304 domain-containing protein [Telluria aromaticivorans]